MDVAKKIFFSKIREKSQKSVFRDFRETGIFSAKYVDTRNVRRVNAHTLTLVPHWTDMFRQSYAQITYFTLLRNSANFAIFAISMCSPLFLHQTNLSDPRNPPNTIFYQIDEGEN